jgi:serine phosphatase RsbU (regulator of sigma subunit)
MEIFFCIFESLNIPMKNEIKALLFFLLITFNLSSQTPKIDSLQNLLKKASHDTTRASLLWQIGWEFKFSDPEKAKKLGEQSLDLSLKTGYRRTEGWAYNLLGALNLINHDTKVARSFFEKGLDAHRSVNNIKGMASCYSNLSNIYIENSLFDSAIIYQEKALSMRLKLTDKKQAADSYNNLGNIYNLKGEYGKASENLFKALKLYEQIDDPYGVSFCYYNIGRTYYTEKKFEKGIEYAMMSRKKRVAIGDKAGIATSYLLEAACKQALMRLTETAEDLKSAIAIQKEIGDKYGLQYSYSQLGLLFFNMKQYDLALEYQLLARDISVETNNIQGIIISNSCIGEIYKEKRNFPLAIEYELKSLEMARKINAQEEIKETLMMLSKIYSAMKNFDKAYEFQSRYISLKDSMDMEASAKQLQDLQAQYDNEKKQKEIELLTKNQEIQDERITRQKILNYAIFSGLVLVGIFAFLTFKRYREKQKANELLAQQKVEILVKNQDLHSKNNLIENQKKEITDSIEYAKTIQHAMLPTDSDIHEIFPQSFVFFKPKDIVSGDFYWFKKVNDLHFVAAVDCTGHGVPGAFMSMIGNDKLNFAVQEKGLTQASEILSELNKGVKDALKQNDSESKSRDGMDIALCVFDIKNDRVEYAGANRVLYKISNGTLTEYTPTKAAIGGFTSVDFDYKNNSLNYISGDIFYLFTDGYADQFGGNSGKKLMTKNLKQLLISVSKEPMLVQKEIIGKSFESWKGTYDQIDDVLVIGLKV